MKLLDAFREKRRHKFETRSIRSLFLENLLWNKLRPCRKKQVQ